MLFGGSFDPIHLDHTKMVENVLAQGLASEVWYVPVRQHSKNFDKLKNMSSVEDRIVMLELVLTPQTRIELYEVESGKPSTTYDTLVALSALYPDKKFSWLIGSDQLPKLHLWLKADGTPSFPDVLQKFDFYVYPRVGYPLDLPYEELNVIENVEPLNDSSTEIRSRVADGESISGLVDKRVEEYIKNSNLYT